ncbi:MAG TPA: hypothetical protein VGE84_10580 [Allosphingosinicella sp.]
MLAAAVLWPLHASILATEIYYEAALGLAAFCGVSILWITAMDVLRHRRRGHRLHAIRIFDIAIALALILPGWLVLG